MVVVEENNRSVMVVEQNRDCRIDQVRKNSLGSISFTTSFRSNLPSPREDRLVLFTMATCVYRNASGHASFVTGILTALEQDSHFDVNKRNSVIVFDDQMIALNLFTRGSFSSSKSQRDLYRRESISSGER